MAKRRRVIEDERLIRRNIALRGPHDRMLSTLAKHWGLNRSSTISYLVTVGWKLKEFDPADMRQLLLRKRL